MTDDIGRDTGAIEYDNLEHRRRMERERQRRCRESKKNKYTTPQRQSITDDSDLSTAASLFQTSFEGAEAEKIQLEALKIVLSDNNFTSSEKEIARNEILKKARMA